MAGAVCDQFRNKTDDKTKNCPYLASYTTDDYVKQCEDGLKACCSDADQKALEEGLKCVDTLATCTSGKEFAYAILDRRLLRVPEHQRRLLDAFF